MAAASMDKLAGLPVEVLLKIFAQCHGFADRYELSSSSQYLNTLAMPGVYKTVVLRTQRDNQVLIQAIRSHPEASAVIENLRYEFTNGDYLKLLSGQNPSDPFEDYSILRLTKNLRTLDITTCGPISPDLDFLRQDFLTFLPSLESCSLEFWDDNGEQWDITPALGLFNHPTLQRLTLQCGAIGKGARIPNLRTRSTPLKELYVLECDIHVQRLSEMLLTPVALSQLVIIQGGMTFNTASSVHDIVDAACSQKKTLKHFKFDSNFVPATHPMLLGGFTALIHLEVDEDHLFGDCDTCPPLERILPPNIERYTFLNQGDSCEDLAEMMAQIFADKTTLAPKLKKIEMITNWDLEIPEAFRKNCEDAGVELEVKSDVKSTPVYSVTHSQGCTSSL